METFTNLITDESGSIAGHYTGVACYSIEEAFRSMYFSTETEFMQKWDSRVPGGIHFPCSVLSRIDVGEEFENRGLGAKGIRCFNEKSIILGCVMGMVRIGWHGEPVAEKKAKNLHFYKKTGWTQIHREHDLEHYLSYRNYKSSRVSMIEGQAFNQNDALASRITTNKEQQNGRTNRHLG